MYAGCYKVSDLALDPYPSMPLWASRDQTRLQEILRLGARLTVGHSDPIYPSTCTEKEAPSLQFQDSFLSPSLLGGREGDPPNCGDL